MGPGPGSLPGWLTARRGDRFRSVGDGDRWRGDSGRSGLRGRFRGSTEAGQPGTDRILGTLELRGRAQLVSVDAEGEQLAVPGCYIPGQPGNTGDGSCLRAKV